MGVGASQRIPLSVLARNPLKGLVLEISPKTGSERGKEGPKETVNRREQQRPVIRTGQSGDESRAERRQKSERPLLGPVDLQMPG